MRYWLTTRYHLLRRHPAVRALRRTVGQRALVAWAAGRRAWRRSLQLRMVMITLLVAGLLVGAFGFLVASMITEGLVNTKVKAAQAQLRSGADWATKQLAVTTDPNDVSLNTTIPGMLKELGESQLGGSDVIVALLPSGNLPIKAQAFPQIDAGTLTNSLIPTSLRQTVAGDAHRPTHVAHQFITVGPPGHPPGPYLVYGAPIPVSFGAFELYYLFPLDAEEQAADLVRTTVIATGAALVVLLAVLAALTTRLVVQPVRTAARTAQRLSAGLLDQRMEVRGEDDLALLAASFNQMAENLQRQIIRLEEMSRLQRRFTSDVSHELRTPLTTVRMAADLIYTARDEFDPAVARSAELLHAELDRFEGLLTDLLEISRFDAGFAVLDAEPTDLVPIVEGVGERLAALAERAGVPFQVRVPEPPVIAEVDPRRVERILRNLVGNAVEHGEGRPVEVTLASDESAVAITVRDHGIGLQPGEEKLVFNRFWRADPSRARQTGGTGLGLSISVEDARLHGGWLEAWGAVGQGAQFRLTLPIRAGDRLVSSPLRLVPDDAVPAEVIQPPPAVNGHQPPTLLTHAPFGLVARLALTAAPARRPDDAEPPNGDHRG
jgi:two-component system sensor histidine kinase MtrB